MKLPTPKWWYVRSGAPAPVIRALLTPISWIWAWATARRMARTEPMDPGAAVICVGNLTAGGTGKTPVVRELLRILRDRGVVAHGLSRGYGGKLKGPTQVDLAYHSAADVGDEPLMMANDGPIWVSVNRAAGAKAAVAKGAQVVVMDDGHQNPTLKKALSLVVVDGETRDGEWPLGDGSVFPAGPLREPLEVGLARADAVILVLPEDLRAPAPELLAMFPGKPILCVRITPVEPPPPGPQMGFAGIGKPWKVERALKAAGCQLVEFANFPDHAAYSEATLKSLAATAAQFGAGLVTTEKDWVRLPPTWRDRITAWPIRATFEAPADLEKLLDRLSL